MTEKDIKRGFNDGYLLSQHKPELAKALKEGMIHDKGSEYQLGFIEGTKQLEKDHRFKSRNYTKLDQLITVPQKGKDKSKFKDQDRQRDI